MLILEDVPNLEFASKKKVLLAKEELEQEYYKVNFPNDGQRFVAWYLRNIHNLDTFETKDCITDGADDKQIDCLRICSIYCKLFPLDCCRRL